MPPRRTNSRGAHVRSVSLADENAPVNSLVGPQRSKAALLSKPTRNGATSSSSKDSTHKSSSSVGASTVTGRRVLGDVSNAVKAAISAKADQDAKDHKPLSKPAKVRRVGSQTSFDHSDSSANARTCLDGPAATFGGNAGKKVAATLKNRSSAQSLNSTGVNTKRKSSHKPTSSSSNPWAAVAPKVLRDELNEVEVIADYDDQIKLDDLDEVSHEYARHEYETIPSRDEQMVLDPQEEHMTLEEEVFSKPESKQAGKAEPEDFTSASEPDHHDHEDMFQAPRARAASFSSEANELSICRNHVEHNFKDASADNWIMLADEDEEECAQIIAAVKADFQEELDYWDATMVAEYSEEIFTYMESLEETTLPNPRYMDAQTEIEWDMRTTLIDWLLQVHMRYHMLPETLWIAVNIIDRFLSKRVVSLVKFQLVGVTAMFVAAKYEEIMAPSVEEFVYMTENGYTRDDILKGEKILLNTLDFRISPYCSPYSWLRRISKADNYDIQTRTLSKFLMELTLLDHRFLRAKSSMVAAIGMYTARRMLGGDWNDAFIYYSGYAEAQLITPMTFLIEFLSTEGFEDRFVYKKYANRKFLKASVFARNQALKRGREESASPEEA
ncbi:hypothetical protein PTTG_05846 [Puccinia triticina 1-1 BBBD Race 1]|uniref:Cyclin N-terminal domain-containing protein n=2 Tax=Puccinia triticina TaxID=208348 RepID=A0A0C4EYE6_PUCT1|nr:uncharacterized protein PtA15_6A402 [Puccinia triticina]OAV89601.1 hypothetical protein PTTG_05846 [Puccinia triticina 1-1 BBBD Race 1]WAQ85773.1 hypothetical protein PtA15_6A402 [Puccinia triticina]WAR55651.1 hypothetical protein PtB15_6B394 [Puccinia triticina]